MNFKAGDWVTLKGNLLDDKFQLTANEIEHGEILLAHFRFGIDKWEHWQPKEGDIIARKFGKNKAIIMRYTTDEKIIGKNPIIEPFIDALPSFLKDTNES